MVDDLVPGSDGLGGPPGTRWRNRTDDTWYQWISSLRKPCAVCLRRHGRLFPRRPERPHPHCECEFLAIHPGAEAPIEFRSAGGLAAAMPVGGQVGLVGPLNWGSSPIRAKTYGKGALGPSIWTR
jgi:hypothetical protein